MKAENKIEGAVFDVDGTILSSMFIWEDAGNRFLEKIGIDPVPELAQKVLTMSVPEGAQFIKDYYNLELERDEIVDGILHIVKDFYYYEAPLKDGILDVLKLLKENGVKMTVATSGDRGMVEAAFKRLGILDYFKAILTCGEIGANKTKPLIFEKAAEIMEVKPEQILVFEDSPHAIKTANAAGFHTVGIYDEYSKDVQDHVKQISEYYLHNWSEFCIQIKTI